MSLTIQNHARNVHSVLRSIVSGERVYTLFLSDVHFDSTKCDRERLTAHLELARERSAAIFLNGDWLDCMGGKYDPRNTLPGGLRPEYRGQDYFDLVVNDSVEFLTPYADLLTVYVQGNHETNVRKRQHTDVSKRLVDGLKRAGSGIELGGYAGWLRWQFARNTERKSYMMHYHHGYGGAAPRSKGVLGVDIDAARYPDADILLRGHDHNKWYVPMTVERLTRAMERQLSTTHHIRCGSYKQLGDGYSGWETEKGFGQPRLGGWFWVVEYKNGKFKDWVEEAI